MTKEHEQTIAKQEWSHFIESNDIGEKPVSFEISAPEDVFPALCKRLDIHAIETLKAELNIHRNELNKVIHVQGKLYADLSQKCVVTMEPVDEHVENNFEAWFADQNQTVSFTKAKRERLSPKERNEQPMIEEAEDPEPVIEGKIDLGELIVQHLSLSLNPYPRLEGVAYESDKKELEDAPEGTYDNPFAALKYWKAGEIKKDK